MRSRGTPICSAGTYCVPCAAGAPGAATGAGGGGCGVGRAAEIAAGAARDVAEHEMDQIARDVLANPVIEDYRVEFLD